MKKIALVAAATLIAGMLWTGGSLVEGQAGTTQVYAVHGLNLEAQTSGGTNVTVCAAQTELIPNFEFGQVVGPVPVPTGSTLQMLVYAGQNVDCVTPGGAQVLIDQTINSVPAGSVALVATQAPGSSAPELLPVVLDTECVDAGSGRLTGVHAANAPAVDVLVDNATVDTIEFGASVEADLPEGSYELQVNLNGTPIVGPAGVSVAAATNQIVYVVGNQDTSVGVSPVVPIFQDLPLSTCEGPTTTSTTTPTPPAPGPTPSPTPAAPVSGNANFTG